MLVPQAEDRVARDRLGYALALMSEPLPHTTAAPGLAARSVARALWLLHTALTLFLIVGWALPWNAALWACLGVAVLMQLQWWLNANECVLTQWETRLLGRPAQREAGPDAPPEEQRFAADLIEGIFHRRPSAACTDRLTYAVVWSSGSLSALRLAYS